MQFISNLSCFTYFFSIFHLCQVDMTSAPNSIVTATPDSTHLDGLPKYTELTPGNDWLYTNRNVIVEKYSFSIF